MEEIDLAALEARTAEPTAALIAELFPFDPLPRTDPAGIRRLGIGRPFEKRPMPLKVAKLHLAEDVAAVQVALRGRIFELIYRHPEYEPKLPILYMLGDMLGAEETRNWGALWTLLNSGDLEGACAEILSAKLERISGSDFQSRKALMSLLLKLQRGEP